MQRLISNATILCCLVFIASCQKQSTNADGSSGGDHSAQGNLPPVTHLFLYPDSVGLDTSASVLQVHWWGDDPDGWVVGYFVRWDYFAEASELTDSIWLNIESTTFYLPLDSAYDEFSLTVRAVDNSANWNWPAGLVVCQAEGGSGLVTAGMLDYVEYEAFLDVGLQLGVYDAGDSLIWPGNIAGMQTQAGMPLEPISSIYLLPPRETAGAIDPQGATLLFPVRNTAPEVEFRIESNPSLLPGQTYQSFPTRSFFWEMTDLDGEQSIDSVFYALDPDSADTSWVGLPGTQNSIMLTGLEPGYHRFFLKIQDIARAQSSTLRFPEADDRFWEVIVPTGRLLIVDDYDLDAANAVLSFYQSIFDTLSGIQGEYSIWEIGSDLPYSGGDVLATLNYFDQVLWYSFYGLSHYTQALGSISSYLEADGALLLTALQVDTTSGVLPVAQYQPALLRVGPPNGFTAVQEGWPDLTLSEFFSNEIFGLEASVSGDSLYNVGAGAVWTGLPCVCVQRTDNWKLIFFGVPLHLLNGAGTLPEFLNRVFNEEFAI